MAYKIKKSRLKPIKGEEFFVQISSRCNYLPVEIVKDVYHALVKTVVQEMKHAGSVYLPDLGYFLLQAQEARNSLNVGTGRIEFLPMKKTIKFKALRKLKEYLNKYNP